MKNTTRLALVLGVSISFFVAEISIGFKTKSLALIADAFHYLNDVVAYAIAFVAAQLQEKSPTREGFTYAFHRAELVGAFFNGVFLLALALSIFLQSLERFINIQEVDDPKDVLIVGCVGLALNIISILFVHDHGSHSHSNEVNEYPDAIEMSEEIRLVHADHHHSTAPPVSGHGHNFGLLGVLIHLCGDAVNNIGVIIAAVLLWKLDSPNRFYADPAASIVISLIIFASAIPLTARTGRILLEAAPTGLDLQKVRDDLSGNPNVLSIHDLHVWHLSQNVILASVHVCVSPELSLQEWEKLEKSLHHCFAEYGVGHVTISPELHRTTSESDNQTSTVTTENGDELIGTCKMPSKEGFGCSFSELTKNPGMRRRDTGHSHSHA